MSYFLVNSTAKKDKNPNELLSYLVLAILLNVFFIYRLGIDANQIRKNHFHPDETTDGASKLEYIFCFVAILIVCALFTTIAVTIGPLYHGMYEDIFWIVGANEAKIIEYKRKTLFKAALKVDLVLNLLFCNTCLFIALAENNAVAWTIFGLVIASLIVYQIQAHIMVRW